MVELPSNILDLQEEDEFIKLLVYGNSGIGKTVFGGSDDEVLFIAPEDNGTLSAKRMGSSAKKWKVRKWKDIVDAYEWLKSLETIPFNWIILDSLTEMQQMCMRSILEEGVRQNPARDPDVPQLQDWIPYFEKVRRMVKSFCALEVNVLFTALEQDEENEDGDKVILPMMQGKGTQYAKQVASWMDAFGRMSVARRKNGEDDDGKPTYEEVRIIQWKASKQVMAKDRTRCLEPRTINLSLKEVRELLESGPRPAVQPGRTVPPKTDTPVKKKETNNEVSLVDAVVGGEGDD